MSSHHIIRDEQEPPVFVFQLNDNWQELSEILGWSPIVLINPLLKEYFELRQTKFDGYLLNESEDIDVKEQDLGYTDLNLANALLKWLNSKNCTALNIFCSDEVVHNLFLSLKNKELSIPLLLFTESGKFILRPHSIFKKWYPEEFKLNILNEDIKNTRNLIKVENGYFVEKAGVTTIEVEGNLILIKEK